MARGKQTCKILKEIRRQIAEANGIEFVTSECRYKGDCLGTCPKCEAEVRYLGAAAPRPLPRRKSRSPRRYLGGFPRHANAYQHGGTNAARASDLYEREHTCNDRYNHSQRHCAEW